MTDKTVAYFWGTYSAQVVPPDVTAMQRFQAQLAFYGGADIMLRMVIEALQNIETAVERLDALRQECEAFASGVGYIAFDAASQDMLAAATKLND